jgi:leucyl-tRNA synthetase
MDINGKGQKALRYGKPIWVNRTRYWLVESVDVVCSMCTNITAIQLLK